MRQLIISTLNLCPTCTETSYLSRIEIANELLIRRRNGGKCRKWYVQTVKNNGAVFNGSKKLVDGDESSVDETIVPFSSIYRAGSEMGAVITE